MVFVKSITAWLTGILFMVILFPLTFAIWLAVLPFDPERKVIHWILVAQSMVLVHILPVLKLSITDKHKSEITGPAVIISNHQSLIDILAMNCLGLRFKWISKAENMRVPVLGWYLRMAGYITVDRQDEESKAMMLERAYRCLKGGTSVMIFPEGTRSKTTEISTFKRGAFQLAIEAGVPILPVVIDGTGNLLPKKGIIFRGKGRIIIRVLEPVQPGTFGTTDPFELAAVFQKKMADTLRQMHDKQEAQ